MNIMNLTQHTATPAQVAAGVFEPADKLAVGGLLTFKAPPTGQEIESAAKRLATLAWHELYHRGAVKSFNEDGEEAGFTPTPAAMIGGAPYLMAALERALKARGITPLYSFTERRSVEEHRADGTVIKTNVFEHVAFVEAV